MNSDRYAALTDGDMGFLARGIGVRAAELASGAGFGALGDDTDRLAAAAFHKFGPAGAALVLEKFMHGYNTTRQAQGQAPVTVAEVKQSVDPDSLRFLEPEEIRQVLKRL